MSQQQHHSPSRRTREQSNITHVPVIFDHDGGVDDFIALVILASAQASPQCYKEHLPQGYELPKLKLLGVTVVEADCFAEPCLDVCRRVLALYSDICPELAHVPVA